VVCPYLEVREVGTALTSKTIYVCKATENQLGDGTSFLVEKLKELGYNLCWTEEEYKKCPFYQLGKNIGI